jgi:hypothetical protein
MKRAAYSGSVKPWGGGGDVESGAGRSGTRGYLGEEIEAISASGADLNDAGRYSEPEVGVLEAANFPPVISESSEN